jgi:aldehyde:ferredoxin oxidoreductase
MRAVSEKGKGSPVTANYQKFGTPNQVKVTNGQQCFPTRYWSSGRFAGWENLSADYMQREMEVTRHGCPNCFLQCTKLSKVLKGRHAGLVLEGPEYETIYALGGLNCLDSLEEVAFLNDLCDKLGLDTMSAGNVSAFAVEAFKRGKSSFAIDYNQPDRIAELLRMVSRREAEGDIFADGVKRAGEALGIPDVAIHVKGLEPGGFDPRVLKGMGLSYATSARGACHLRGTFYKAELSGEIAKDQIEGKALLQIDYEDRAALFDCMVLCRFFRDFIGWSELSTLVRATCGLDLDTPALQKLANRITQETRRYNWREGIPESADRLPARFLRESTAEGATLNEADLLRMVSDYNSIRAERERS